MKSKIFVVLVVCLQTLLHAQPIVVDKIIGQVDENIILKSDVETVYMQDLQQNKGSLPPDYRCTLLQQYIAQKLLIVQAAKDSVIVSDNDVEYELERRIRYFETMFGSRERMEEYYGKSVQEMKEEFRDDIRSQLLAQTMQDQLFGDISISPSEVKEFFKKIPADSLPYFNAEVELSQIVMIPEPTAEQKSYAREKTEDLRKRIANGESFESIAEIYTDDRDELGNARIDLGCVGRGEFVPEFEAAAFKLTPGQVSDVVQTQFGYHIIKLISRQGDNICLKHMLIMPKTTSTNITIATKKLDSIRSEIIAGKTTFYDAASKYSMDELTKYSGGSVENPNTGNTFFEMNQLEPDMYYLIEKMAPGEISAVNSFTTQEGKKAVRIVILKSESQPHIASIETDYDRMQQAALQEKKFRLMDEWLKEKIKTVYLKIDPVYSACENLQELVQIANNTK